MRRVKSFFRNPEEEKKKENRKVFYTRTRVYKSFHTGQKRGSIEVPATGRPFCGSLIDLALENRQSPPQRASAPPGSGESN